VGMIKGANNFSLHQVKKKKKISGRQASVMKRSLKKKLFDINNMRMMLMMVFVMEIDDEMKSFSVRQTSSQCDAKNLCKFQFQIISTSLAKVFNEYFYT
jgi:phosphoribosylformylglycinamidine (FGAM) synthase PurS component